MNVPVMSLRTSGPLGNATNPIINPNNLKVEGWYVTDRFSGSTLVLVASDVRDFGPKGLIVNDHEVLVAPEDLVRLQPIMDIGFVLLGKQVVSQSGQKYGKVSDFAVETEGLLVKKLYASQSIVKNFSGGSFSVDRTQIIEITNTKIIIEDPTEKIGATATSPSLAN